MSKFVSALKGLFQKSGPKATEEGKRESRVYQRFNLSHSDLFSVTLPDGTLAPLINISFGGMGIRKAPTDVDTFPIVIGFLDHSVVAKLGITHRGAHSIGTRFEPREPHVITFLQPILQAVGHGLSMRTIDPSSLKDTTRDEFEWVLRGEGPTDLLVSSSDDPCAHTVLTFLSGKEYLELNIKDRVVTTLRSLDTEGRATRMSRDKTPDIRTLEIALLILTGVMEQVSLGEVLGPVMQLLRSERDRLKV